MSTFAITGFQAPLVQITPEALSAKSHAISACQNVTVVENDLDAEYAGSVLVDISRVLKQCEESRKAVKRPVIDLGALIDRTASHYSSFLESESTRIRGLVGAYNARVEEQRRVAERKRQEELARIERERIEAERKAQEEAARIERERLAAEAEAKRKVDEAFANAKTLEQAEVAARAAEDAAKQAAAKAKRDAEAAEEARLATARALDQQSASSLAFRSAKAAPIAGVSVKSEWKFEVVDIDELHKHNPKFVTLTHKAREINAAISSGHRSIPGLRIWEEKGVKVRA